MTQQHVVIIGGGLAGLVTAIHLIDACASPFKLSIVEERDETGRGIAYSTSVTEHLVNGPAKVFSLYPDEPTNLAQWLTEHAAASGWQPPTGVQYPDSYPPRWLYGDYVRAQFERALNQADGRVEYAHVKARAVDLLAAGQGYEVLLNDGNALRADRVVLATGLFNTDSDTAYRVSPSLKESPQLIRDIWQNAPWQRVGADESILLIGSGLTAVDAMICAESAGFKGTYTVISRNGLIAQVRRDVPPLADVFKDGLPDSTTSLLRLVGPIRRRLKAEGGDWQQLSGAIRGQLLNLWDGANLTERQRFITRLRRFWEISIHRVAPESGRTLTRLLEGGRLKRLKGRVQGLELSSNGRVQLTWRAAGEQQSSTAQFDRVVAAHGYEFDWAKIRDPLIQQLQARQWVQRHITGFGVDGDRATGGVRLGNGQISTSLFAVGHPLRGVTWESSAISEVALGASVAAQAIARQLDEPVGLSPIVAHIVAARPSAQARAAARLGVLDFLAVSLPVAWHLVPDAGLDKVWTLFNATDAATTALRLGYQAHALDYDDTLSGMRGHPSTVILPALLSLVAHRDAPISVDAVLDAYVVGVELCVRLAAATGERHYPSGFHSTATIGSIAAAGAAAYLLKLDAAAIDNSLGLAATRAAGLRAQFGSAAKPLHAALGARNAVESALLASIGFEGNPNVLQAFLHTAGGGAEQPQLLAQAWGPSWQIVAPGLTFKRYPTCGGTHGAADAALILRRELLERPGFEEGQIAHSIDRVQVSFPPGADIAPCIRQPGTGVQARFSLEYVIATALLEGRLALERFADVPVQAHIAALAEHVQRVPDSRFPGDASNPAGRFHELTLTLRDGTQLATRVTRDEVNAVPVDVRHKLQEALRFAPQAQVGSVLRWAQLQISADLDALITALQGTDTHLSATTQTDKSSTVVTEA